MQARQNALMGVNTNIFQTPVTPSFLQKWFVVTVGTDKPQRMKSVKNFQSPLPTTPTKILIMTTADMIKKLEQIQLSFFVHPDRVPDSEFADCVDTIGEIIVELESFPDLVVAVTQAYNFARHSADDASTDEEERDFLSLKKPMEEALIRANALPKPYMG
jgi:hypothetical protein